MLFVLDQMRQHLATFMVRSGLFVLTLAGSVHVVQAQENRLATQSMKCAAIFTVLAQDTSSEPLQVVRLNKAVDIFTEVHLQEMPLPVSSTSRENALKRREHEVMSLRSAWLAKDPSLREEGVLCGAWAEGFLAQGERVQFVPVFPKVVAPGIRNQYQRLLEDKMGR